MADTPVRELTELLPVILSTRPGNTRIIVHAGSFDILWGKTGSRILKKKRKEKDYFSFFFFYSPLYWRTWAKLCSTSPEAFRGCLCPNRGSDDLPSLRCRSPIKEMVKAATPMLSQNDEPLHGNNHRHHHSGVYQRWEGPHAASLKTSVIFK